MEEKKNILGFNLGRGKTLTPEDTDRLIKKLDMENLENNTFTLKQMFSIVDGRLSTSMDDVYTILNIAADENLTTIALPIIMDRVSEIKPKWYTDALTDLEVIKDKIGDDFETLMKHLDTVQNTYEVKALGSVSVKN